MVRSLPAHLSWLLLAASFVCLTSCIGTVRSRWEVADSSGRDFFGWPLLQAVGEDVDIILTGGTTKRATSLERAIAYPSLPVDLVLDVVLLPFDVIAGLSGFDKRARPTESPTEPLPYRPNGSFAR
ncbi:MAG: hypothetical protein KDC48_20255 [Planctomycetes bacterium]|nr:hypothetical protein [Planctomycetota bacterium]